MDVTEKYHQRIFQARINYSKIKNAIARKRAVKRRSVMLLFLGSGVSQAGTRK